MINPTRTILIPIFQGVEARNILRTDIFKILAKTQDLRLVLLVPHRQKMDYYQKEFYGPNIFYEVFDNYQPRGLDRLFGLWNVYLLNTKTMDIKRRIRLEDEKSLVLYILSWIVNRVFARRFFRKIFRWLDYHLVHCPEMTVLLDKYHPDLIFAAHLFSDLESALLREARRKGVETVGLINSWDKFTARNIIRTLPDKLFVHNLIIKQEAIDYGDFSEDDILVVGIPHFDYYLQPPRMNRADLFNKIGADISKKLILFAPVGKSFSDVDWELIQILGELLKSGDIKVPVQVLVRFPPNDVVEVGDLSDKKDFIFENPGVRFSVERGVDWDMPNEELLHLRDEMAHIDLLITHVSTLIIEAAINDKPIIAIDFDGKQPRPLSRSATRLLRFTHFQPMLKSGGLRVAKNADGLAEIINLYLKNPALDREGRRRIVEEQCWKLDGKAGERVANFILSYL